MTAAMILTTALSLTFLTDTVTPAQRDALRQQLEQDPLVDGRASRQRFYGRLWMVSP